MSCWHQWRHPVNRGRRKISDLQVASCISVRSRLHSVGSNNQQVVSKIYCPLISILYVFSKKMPICTVFLHVALDISPKHLLLTIGTCSILVFSQVLESDVPLAVWLVWEGSLTGETGKGSIIVAVAELVGRFQHCHCNRFKLKEDLENFQRNGLLTLASFTTYEDWFQLHWRSSKQKMWTRELPDPEIWQSLSDLNYGGSAHFSSPSQGVL